MVFYPFMIMRELNYHPAWVREIPFIPPERTAAMATPQGARARVRGTWCWMVWGGF